MINLAFDNTAAIILNAIFTGIGVAIGQPIGQYFFKKYIHKPVKVIHKEIIKKR